MFIHLNNLFSYSLQLFINRIKPKEKRYLENMIKRSKKYYAPQNENVAHVCDHPGCTEKGEYRAPKDRNLKEYYWFCLKHVQEYNAKWNYYSGEGSDSQDKETERKKMHFGRGFNSKIRYQFGYDLWEEAQFFDEGYANTNSYSGEYSDDGIYYTVEERRCLKVLEIGIKEINPKVLKKKYKALAKKYHPDLNRGDKESEEKFKQISAAYQTLCDKFARLPNYDM